MSLTPTVQGGSRTIRAFMEVGALDRLGIIVLPILLGAGLPLFALEVKSFSRVTWDASRTSPLPGR